MSNLITIRQAVENFKKLIESSVKKNGVKGKEAMIRSSKPINNIHEAVKADLIRNGIAPHRIHPPIGETKPELKLAGFNKQKNQDICISPEGCTPKEEILTEGVLRGVQDCYGKDCTERTISINIRSQMSSLAKNFDTLYERTIAEAQNLHVRCPKMVLGEVYMIPIKEYDVEAMKSKKIKFLDNRIDAIEKYIKSFQAISGRANIDKEEYKYERVCLLLVDLEQNPIKIYSTSQELHKEGLLDKNSKVGIEGLSWKAFTETILQIYETRFGS